MNINYDDFDLNNDNEIENKNDSIPPLFKYTTVYRAKELLFDNIMYLPEISELNDPFEGELLYNKNIMENAYYKFRCKEYHEKFREKFLNDSDIDIKDLDGLFKTLWEYRFNEYFKGLKEYLQEGIYLICLSKSKNINSLWAHYANNHDGICIEYDVNECNNILKDFCFPIEYVDESDYTLDLKSHVRENNLDLNLLLKPFLRKSKEWEYEKEWRIILNENMIKNNSDYYPYKPYIKFIPPKKVYMGFKISSKNEKLIKEICRIKSIPLAKAEKCPDKYDFEFSDVEVNE